jgi:hypothetical protein
VFLLFWPFRPTHDDSQLWTLERQIETVFAEMVKPCSNGSNGSNEG